MGVVLDFNANTVDPDAGIPVLETGRYTFVILASEEKETNNKKGSMIVFTNQVISENARGQKYINRLTTKHENVDTVRIALAALSAICHVTGRLSIRNTAELHGIPYCVDIVKEPRTDKPGSYTNNIVGYYDAQGNPPVKGQPGNSGGAQASQGDWGGDSGSSASNEPDWGNSQQTQAASTNGPDQAAIEAEVRQRMEAEAKKKLQEEIEARVRAEMQAKATTTTAAADPAPAGGSEVPDWAR